MYARPTNDVGPNLSLPQPSLGWVQAVVYPSAAYHLTLNRHTLPPSSFRLAPRKQMIDFNALFYEK